MPAPEIEVRAWAGLSTWWWALGRPEEYGAAGLRRRLDELLVVLEPPRDHEP